jgi:serine phosphatase RsbU (regulator of sigma subunit)
MASLQNFLSDADKPPTILIVDDAKLNRELLRMHLAKHGLRFIFAENGHQAIQMLAANPGIDLILLDLVMPEMDGFAFLEWRKGQAEAQTVPVIVNSSLDDFESIAKALTMGSYDYFTKPLNNFDLEVVLPLKIKNAVNSRRLMAETRRQNEVMRGELAMAARYQQFLLPRQVSLKGVQVAYLFQPCSDVGGDYFDFFETDTGQVGLMVADVSGHGVAAAMTASIVKALLPGYLERMASPAAAFKALNSDLLRLTQEDAFVTAVAVFYDPQAGRLTWSLAGHPSPLFIPAGQPPRPLSLDSVFLGAFENDSPMARFEERSLAVGPGDRLVLYTDGLTEAPGLRDELYGRQRLEQLLADHGAEPISQLRESLWEDLNRFVHGDFPDDVAFILVEF